MPFLFFSSLLLLLLVLHCSLLNANNLDDEEQMFEELVENVTDDNGKAELIREAIKHAWHGYLDYAHLADDLKPLSKTGDKWLHARTTFYDALDTLYIVGLHDEFNSAISEIIKTSWHTWNPWTYWHQGVPTSVIYPVKTFEYHIRIVGGLLGAFMMSGKRELLHSAQFAMDCILISFDTSNGLPRPHTRIAHPTITPVLSGIAQMLDRIRASYDSEVWSNTLAGIGSFGLELRILSRETGDPKYKRYAEKIHSHVYTFWNNELYEQKDGFQKKLWNVPKPKDFSMWDLLSFSTKKKEKMIEKEKNEKKEPSFYQDIGFGSGGDSYYEYLLKETLLEKGNPKSFVPLLQMYHALVKNVHQEKSGEEVEEVKQAEQAEQNVKEDNVDSNAGTKTAVPSTIEKKKIKTKNYVTTRNEKTGAIYLTNLNSETSSHLGCFAGGLLALGYDQLDQPLKDLTMAQSITEHCVQSYLASPLGLAGETFLTNVDGTVKILSPDNQLRPEVIESLFVLWRVTRDEKWKKYAWDIFISFQRHCKINSGGYSGIRNVLKDPPVLDDYQASFFIAETLKYLYLIFAADEEVESVEQLGSKEGTLDLIPLSKYVFTTEAHPMTIQPRCEMKELIPCSGPLQPSFIQTLPWDAIGLVLLLLVCVWKCLKDGICCCCLGCSNGCRQGKIGKSEKEMV